MHFLHDFYVLLQPCVDLDSLLQVALVLPLLEDHRVVLINLSGRKRLNRRFSLLALILVVSH